MLALVVTKPKCVRKKQEDNRKCVRKFACWTQRRSHQKCCFSESQMQHKKKECNQESCIETVFEKYGGCEMVYLCLLLREPDGQTGRETKKEQGRGHRVLDED